MTHIILPHAYPASFEQHRKGKKYMSKARLDKSETDAKASNMSVQKVEFLYTGVDLCRQKFEDWLCNVVRLDRYLTIFEDNGYDDITMIPFMDQDVIQRELNISNKLHCKLILKRIDEFKEMVCEFDAFLDKNVDLQHYKNNLREHGIITIMLLKADIQNKQDIARVMGIKQKLNIHKIWNIIYGSGAANVVHRTKLKCYYSDRSFDNPDHKTCIGAMLNIQCDEITKSKFAIELLSSSRDCISFHVWDPNKLNIQMDSKHIEYTHFLPLIINEEHGKRINKLLLQQIAGITPGRGFRAQRALFVMASLLNSVIKRLHKKLSSISDSLALWS
eukprot:484563_1